MPSITSVRRALKGRYKVQDLDSVVQIVDLDGQYVAHALLDPLLVQVDIGAVFMLGERPVEERIPEAHALLEALWERTFRERGFELDEEGEVREGEVVDEPGRIIRSYERAITAEVGDLAALGELLDWIREQETEIIL